MFNFVPPQIFRRRVRLLYIGEPRLLDMMRHTLPARADGCAAWACGRRRRCFRPASCCAPPHAAHDAPPADAPTAASPSRRAAVAAALLMLPLLRAAPAAAEDTVKYEYMPGLSKSDFGKARVCLKRKCTC